MSGAWGVPASRSAAIISKFDLTFRVRQSSGHPARGLGARRSDDDPRG